MGAEALISGPYACVASILPIGPSSWSSQLSVPFEAAILEVYCPVRLYHFFITLIYVYLFTHLLTCAPLWQTQFDVILKPSIFFDLSIYWQYRFVSLRQCGPGWSWTHHVAEGDWALLPALLRHVPVAPDLIISSLTLSWSTAIVWGPWGGKWVRTSACQHGEQAFSLSHRAFLFIHSRWGSSLFLASVHLLLVTHQGTVGPENFLSL